MNEDTFTIDELGNPKISDNGAVAGATAAFSAGKDLSDVVNEQIKDPNFAPSDVIGIQDASKYSARDWENVRDSFYDGRSSSGEIAKNAAKQFAYNFMTLGDKAEIALGAIANLSSDGLLGDEMIEQGRIALDSKLSTISDMAALSKDSESLVSQITQGAMSMTEMMVTGLLTGGVMPLIEISTDSLGTGTYNNVKKYYDENGSLNGYKTGAFDLSIDVLNAGAQSYIEHKLGFGGKFINRMLSRTSGAFLKEFAGGFAQEFTQGALGDVAEVIKGNEGISILEKNLKNYVVSGMIGGVMQGAMGSAVYKYNHIKAVDSVVDFAVINGAENTPELRSKAEQMIVDEEKELTPDYWNEMANRLDVNNNRGKLKDNLIDSLEKSQRIKQGLADSDELDADQIQDIQDSSELIMRQALRMSYEQGTPISKNPLMNVKVDSDGNLIFPNVDGISIVEREQIDKVASQIIEKPNQKYKSVVIKQKTPNFQGTRGAYDSVARKVVFNKKADVGTILNEFTNVLTTQNFQWARSGKASANFAQQWREIEDWAGIKYYDKVVDRSAIEKISKAYEQWVMEGGKGAPDSLKSLFTRLSAKMTDIYDDYKLGYFADVGKMSPALESWFANNEKLYLLVNNREPDELEKKREQIIAELKVEMARQGTADQQTQALNNQVEKNADANGMVGVSDQNAYSDQANKEDDKFNTGKQRERGISKAVRKSTQEQTGVELEKDTYTQRAVKKAVLTAPEFVQVNPDQSYEIIMGAPEVGGYRREELFAAYLDHAQSEITNGNMEYVYKLQNIINSDMAKKRTEEGQRNAALRRYDNNVVRIDETLRELQQVSESEKAIVQSELSELEMSIQKTDKSINIDEVLKEVECQ